MNKKIKVIQWGTGAVGACSLRQIIDHPCYELVGVWVSGSKAGSDAGELCGRDPTGIIATSSREEIYAMEADVVMHHAIAVTSEGALPFDEDVLALLRSGKNVISTAAYFSPFLEGPEMMARLEEACQAGGVTVYGTGVDPGLATDRIAAVATACTSDVRSIRMIESVDLDEHPSFELISENAGFGKFPEERNMESPGAIYFGTRILPGAVAKLADMLDIKLDEIKLEEEVIYAEEDVEAGMGTIKKGTMRGASVVFSGMVGGEAFIIHQWIHYIGEEGLPDHWLVRPRGDGVPPYVVRLEIEGATTLEMDMTFRDEEDITSYSAPTAAVGVNAIPDVVNAPPGYLQEGIFGRWRNKLN